MESSSLLPNTIAHFLALSKTRSIGPRVERCRGNKSRTVSLARPTECAVLPSRSRTSRRFLPTSTPTGWDNRNFTLARATRRGTQTGISRTKSPRRIYKNTSPLLRTTSSHKKHEDDEEREECYGHHRIRDVAELEEEYLCTTDATFCGTREQACREHLKCVMIQRDAKTDEGKRDGVVCDGYIASLITTSARISLVECESKEDYLRIEKCALPPAQRAWRQVKYPRMHDGYNAPRRCGEQTDPKPPTAEKISNVI